MTSRGTSTTLRTFLPRGGALSDEAWSARHRGITVLAWLHVPVLAGISLWQGHDMGGEHMRGHMGTANLLGCLLAGLLAAAGSVSGSQRWRSSMVTLSLLTSTALLIHLFNGLIEMHFHFFVVIAVVAMYQSWTPYLLALAFVVAHHGLMGLIMPMQVYNHAAAIDHPVAFSLLHGAFVLAESVACLTYWKINESALDSERAARLRAQEMGENLGRANREISDLLAMMSHDLRTPATVINGYAALALESWEDFDDDTRRDLVRKMGASGRSLMEMLDDTLTMSAHDAEGLHSRPVAVRVDQAVRATLATQTVALPPVDLTGMGATTALVDRGQLQQVLGNLLTNAAKYGEAPFSVSSVAEDETVEIVVADSGRGVPTAFVPRLFDRYARADEARRGGQKGTGLGLYIVRQLVEANGGTVTYATSPTGGAAFVVRLPRALRLAMPLPDDEAPDPLDVEPGPPLATQQAAGT